MPLLFTESALKQTDLLVMSHLEIFHFLLEVGESVVEVANILCQIIIGLLMVFKNVTHFLELPKAVEVFRCLTIFYLLLLIIFFNDAFIDANRFTLFVFPFVLFFEHLVKLPLMECSHNCKYLEET